MNNNFFKLTINNVKNIVSFQHEFSLEKGIYVISSENGNGKSTLFSAISQLIGNKRVSGTGLNTQPLRKKPIANAYIEYEFDNKIDKYVFDYGKSNNWILEKENGNISVKRNIKEFNGFCELSVTYGTRFCYTKNIFEKLESSILTINKNDANKWVVEKLGFIIKNNPDFYQNKLKVIDKNEIKGRLGDLRRLRHKNIYLIEHNGDYIYPYEFSTGENLVLGILDFLNDLRSKKSRKTTLILIDEIEIGLHPLAQKNLLFVLNEIISGENLNLCIYLSTHSPTIISNIPDVNNLMELKNRNGKVSLEYNPASSILQTLTNDLHKDKYIFVEDKPAKSYIDIVLNKMNISQKYMIIYVGGYDNTVKLHFQLLPILGDSLITILDGDSKSNIRTKIKNQSEADVDNILINNQKLNGVSLFQVDELFKQLKNKQYENIQYKLNIDNQLQDYLNEYKELRDKHDKTSDKNEKAKLKKNMKDARNEIAQISIRIIQDSKNNQIDFLPVMCLETVFFQIMKTESDKIVEKFTNLQQFSYFSNKGIKDILSELNEKYDDTKSTDVHKKMYEDLLNKLQLNDSVFLQNILAPLIEEKYPNEVQELKNFLLRNIK